MRWNCPHCATRLEIKDELLNHGWNFSRCYRCDGFALVKPDQPDPIRLDMPGAPNPTAAIAADNSSFSAYSLENLTRARDKLVNERSHADIKKEEFIAAVTQKNPVPPPPPRALVKKIATFPEPLPQVPVRPWKKRIIAHLLPTVVMIMGAAAAASGVYLYKVGKSFMHRASTPAPVTKTLPEKTAAIKQPNPATASAVRIRAKNTILRAGPGQDYAVLGAGISGSLHPVLEARGEWLRIQTPAPGGVLIHAWVRGSETEIQ